MTITYMDLYNDVTGQAWSMFDGEVEAKDEFETSVTSSIQKALSYLWNSYNFTFRNKSTSFKTKADRSSYSTPNGNIVQKTINHKRVYCIKNGTTFLSYEPDYEILEEATGEPTKFYIKNDTLYLYPTPDDVYKIDVDYWNIYPVSSEDGLSKATFEDETDYIDIDEKYENLFKMALLPLCMVYAIASDSDENTSGYKEQYENAYKNLIEQTQGIAADKCWGWR